jgi:hypothetical protein
MPLKSWSWQNRSWISEMKNVRRSLRILLHPPGWLVLVTGLLAFGSLGAVFSFNLEESVFAYLVYPMCVYDLVVVIAILPQVTNRVRSAMIQSKVANKIVSTSLVSKYLADREFRAIVSLSQGMGFNLLYGLYHSGVGMLYHSVWSVSLGAYYLGLGLLRAYLLWMWQRSSDIAQERRCFRRTAAVLFLLNIPMGGVIVLVVMEDQAFSYPGHVIYLSALYAFYAIIAAAIHLIKSRKTGRMFLSASKVLSMVSAMMSILALQTALLSRFSAESTDYSHGMNAATGFAVWASVLFLAVGMLVYERKQRQKEGVSRE